MKEKTALRIASKHPDCIICQQHADTIREMSDSPSHEDRQIVGLAIGNLKRHIKGGKHVAPDPNQDGGHYGTLIARDTFEKIINEPVCLPRRRRR